MTEGRDKPAIQLSPHYRLQRPCIPFASVATFRHPQPYSHDSRMTTSPHRRPAGTGDRATPSAATPASVGGVHCLKAVYGHPEVASLPLCALGITSQDAWQEAHSQTAAPGPRGADVVGPRGRGRPQQWVCVPVPPPPGRAPTSLRS